MRMIRKTALATAISAIGFSVHALEALDDEFLGDVTGQEGITIDQTYKTTIEEFQYVDGDTDASGNVGKVSIKDIKIGNYSGVGPTDLAGWNGTSTLGTISETGMMIDATSTGVLITEAQIGPDADVVVNEVGSPTHTDLLPNTDASGNLDLGGLELALAGAGATSEQLKLRTFADGKDISIGSINIGNANKQMASIGSVDILNASTHITSGQLLRGATRFDMAGGPASAQFAQLFAQNANTHIKRQTLISSKTSGTGVVVESEGGINAQALVYTDGDTAAGNQIGVVGLVSFRIASADELGDNADSNGTYLRGSYSKMTVDVEGGKLVLSDQVSESTTYLDKVFIGDLTGAQFADAGVIGGIAIIGNRTEGTTSIYAH